MASEVEETLKRLVGHKGVIGTIVVNNEGVPIKSTLDNPTTVQYSGLLNNLVDQAKTMFKELDPSNDLTFLRIRTKKHEIMVAPDRDYLLIVIQNTQDSWALQLSLYHLFRILSYLIYIYASIYVSAVFIRIWLYISFSWMA